MHTLRRSRSSASQCQPIQLPKKLVVFGDENSGKTCLIYRINYNKYMGDEDARMVKAYDHFQYEKLEDSYQVKLMLVDVNQYYERLLPLYCEATDVALMCLAIDARDSLDRLLNYWKARVLDVHCKGVPLILVGTKSDLRGELQRRRRRDDHDDDDTLIAREDALRVADQIGAVAYLECSAKLGDGVRDLCDYAVKLAVHAAKAVKADRRKSKCVLS